MSRRQVTVTVDVEARAGEGAIWDEEQVERTYQRNGVSSTSLSTGVTSAVIHTPTFKVHRRDRATRAATRGLVRRPNAGAPAVLTSWCRSGSSPPASAGGQGSAPRGCRWCTPL